MHSMRYVGMAITFFGLIALVGLGGIAGVLMSVTSEPRRPTWVAFRERLPAFLGLLAYLVTLVLLVYAVIWIMRHYGG